MSARKVRLVTELIVGRSVQDAMDILKFTSKRAAGMIDKVLKSAVADADEQQADTDSLYVSSARPDRHQEVYRKRQRQSTSDSQESLPYTCNSYAGITRQAETKNAIRDTKLWAKKYRQ
ncbi:MAG: large ribosomal subunit protein uL22, partial [Planctomycetota bacterium]|jgi:large subunit ribosomal protein L22